MEGILHYSVIRQDGLPLNNQFNLIMSLSRRELLRVGLGVGLAILVKPGSIFAQEKTKASENEESIKITRELITHKNEKGGISVFGHRMNDAWQENNGKWYCVFERGILEYSSGSANLFPSLDVMSASGLDGRLDSGLVGVTVPPVQLELSENSILSLEDYMSHFKQVGVTESVYTHIQRIKSGGIDLGVPKSYVKDYGAYTVWRFGGMAFQQWKEDGRIEGILVGVAAFRVGMVPDSSQFNLQLDLEPEFRKADELDRFLPSTRGSDRRECAHAPQVWTGECTYYSHAGCVGCSPNQIMANGRKFDENANTMAFMKTPLGSFVSVENLDTGVRVDGVEVTDRGGFEKYGILADLSLGLSNRLGNRSRDSRIKITWNGC